MFFPNLSQRDPEPWYLDYARSFFPVLLIVFILRAFIAEPFRIPSGSMLPTLEVGDFILVNKYDYGIRLPIVHKKILPVNNPERGDIMVFRYPGDNTTNYIKRVIGIPGDTVEYRNKALYINGQLIETKQDGSYMPYSKTGKLQEHERLTQLIPSVDLSSSDDKVSFSILHDPSRYSSRNRVMVVPQGHYFMLGDNRDHSQDSRFWGLVPDENIVGKAFFIWFHYNGNPGGGWNFARIGENI
jgi:signal peptidase I